MNMLYLIVIEETKNNYCAYSPDVDGCVTTGDTIEETIMNMQAALEFHFEDEPFLPIPNELSYWLERKDQICTDASLTHFIQIEINREVNETQN